MPSFIIVRYAWQVLGRGVFLPPPRPHPLTASKKPIPNRVKYICTRRLLWQPITDYFFRCFLIFGGWFEDRSIYINLTFGFLYGRYLLFSNLNFTSGKSTSVTLVIISISKLIFLKILIISFRILSFCCLFF